MESESEQPVEPTRELPAGDVAPARAARFVRPGEDGASFVRPDAGTGEPPSVARRLAAFVVGFGALGMAGIGVLVVLLVMLSAARPPNPFEADGFLCCSTADTWRESGKLSGLALFLVAADVAGFVLAAGLLRYAVVHRGFKLRRLIQLPALSLLPALVLIGGGMAARWDDKRTPPNCDTFTFDRGAWQGLDGEPERERQALGVVHCMHLEGQTVSQVERRLGRDEIREAGRGGRSLGWYGQVQVEYFGFRAHRVELIPPYEFD